MFPLVTFLLNCHVFAKTASAVCFFLFSKKQMLRFLSSGYFKDRASLIIDISKDSVLGLMISNGFATSIKTERCRTAGQPVPSRKASYLGFLRFLLYLFFSTN